LVDLGGLSLVILAEQSLSFFALFITVEEVESVDKLAVAVAVEFAMFDRCAV
jgi:hypothetical protein